MVEGVDPPALGGGARVSDLPAGLEKRLRVLADVPSGPLFGADLERYNDLVAAAHFGAVFERERCARIADQVADAWEPCAEALGARRAAREIRESNRGSEKT